MKISSLGTVFLLAVMSMLASACSSPYSVEQAYGGMTSADFALAGSERSIFSSHNF